MINFSIELRGLNKVLQDLSDRKFAVMKAAAMALNKAASHARAQIVKMAREDYTMPAKRVRDAIEIKKANMRWLVAKVSIKRDVIPLIEFKTKGTGRHRSSKITAASKTKKKRGIKIRIPVAAMVKISGGYKVLPKAFKAKGKYGLGIFQRVGKERGPLKVLHGPSVGGIVNRTANIERIMESTEKTLQREFNQAIDYALDKGRIGQGEFS